MGELPSTPADNPTSDRAAQLDLEPGPSTAAARPALPDPP